MHDVMLLVWQITYSKESLLNAYETDAAMAKKFIIASLCDNMSKLEDDFAAIN
jgi:hypothetical protein